MGESAKTMNAIRVNDIELHVVDQGRGDVLLLVHGFPLDHTMWQEQIADLASGFRVIAPDLRGFGRSGVSAGVVSMEQFADDLAGLLDHLSVDTVTLCGLSMGGYIAWDFWRKHRHRLERLILCDTRAAADPPEAAQTRRETARRVVSEGTSILPEGMLEKLFAPATRQHRQDIIDATRAVILNTSPEAVAAASLGMAQRSDAWELLADIGVPTLVICGRDDAISTVQEMRGIAGRIRNATFVEIPDAGHLSPLENPVAVNTAIREFMAKDET
jgi:pimeloyl-ACP methyl ester carboxylesterase